MVSVAAAERGRCRGAIGYSTDGQSHEQERRQRREDTKKQNRGKAKRKEDGPKEERKKLHLRAWKRSQVPHRLLSSHGTYSTLTCLTNGSLKGSGQS